MSSAKRILIFGGLALALLTMTFGLWYAVFAEHQALDGMGGSLTKALSAAATRNDGQIRKNMDEYREARYRYDRNVDAHSHWIGLAMLLIVLGIGFDYVSLSATLKRMLAWMLLAGSLSFPFGVLLQTATHTAVPKALAVMGSALVIAALSGTVVGILRRPNPA